MCVLSFSTAVFIVLVMRVFVSVLRYCCMVCGGLQSVCEAVCESEEEFWEDVVMESTKKG